MAVILDMNICLFQEQYMASGYQEGQEVAQLLLAWLVLQFPGVQHFSLYLVGNFDRLFARMDQSLVNIHPQTFLEFARGLTQAVSGSVKFKTSQDSDKASVFSQLVQQPAANPNDQQILLGALSQDLRSVLAEEKQKSKSERIALLETVERLTGAPGFSEFRRVSNDQIFRDRLYAAGM